MAMLNLDWPYTHSMVIARQILDHHRLWHSLVPRLFTYQRRGGASKQGGRVWWIFWPQHSPWLHFLAFLQSSSQIFILQPWRKIGEQGCVFLPSASMREIMPHWLSSRMKGLHPILNVTGFSLKDGIVKFGVGIDNAIMLKLILQDRRAMDLC